MHDEARSITLFLTTIMDVPNDILPAKSSTAVLALRDIAFGSVGDNSLLIDAVYL